MQHHKKLCSSCNTEQYLFSRGMCLQCWRKSPYNKSKLKSGTKPLLKRKSVSEATRTRLTALSSYVYDATSQPELFRMAWEKALEEGNGRVVCPFTLKDITKFQPYHPRWMNFCLHILNKKNYPRYRLALRNIVIADETFHQLVDQGTEAQRAEHPEWNFAKWYEIQEKLKNEYNKQTL